jgi:hypothetical protein
MDMNMISATGIYPYNGLMRQLRSCEAKTLEPYLFPITHGIENHWITKIQTDAESEVSLWWLDRRRKMF